MFVCMYACIDFSAVEWGNGYTEGSPWHHSFPPYGIYTGDEEHLGCPPFTCIHTYTHFILTFYTFKCAFMYVYYMYVCMR